MKLNPRGAGAFRCKVGNLVVAFTLASAGACHAQASRYDWQGFYLGGHVGLGIGQSHVSVQDPTATNSGKALNSVFGGVHAGYNYVLPSNVVIGAEADMTFPNFYQSDEEIWSGVTSRSLLSEQLDYISTLRGRLGYAFDNVLVYGTGGFAFSSSHFVRTDPQTGDEQMRSGLRTGWAAGAGVEFGFEKNWSARFEYLYSHLGPASAAFTNGAQYSSDFSLHEFRFGLNRKFGGVGSDKLTVATGAGLSESDRWEIRGQTTYIQQAYPNFSAPYTGENSFPPGAQSKQTWTVSAFLGLRLWDGGELYYNPELLQGFGLSGTVGAGGFPNGEAQKSDFILPHYNTSRLFLRHSFGFGGEQETVESAYGQMGGKRDISRVSIQVGKFAVHDVFDNNTYAQDPRVDFLNWSIWAGGAFDYPADKVGLTYGAVAEFNQKSWAVRAGYFLIGDKSNSNNFDSRTFERGGYVAELETRYSLFSQPGKFRLIGWVNTYFAGSYRDAINLSAATGIDPTTAIADVRRGTVKYGYVLNFEQALADDVGIFGRWSWNNGRTEISAFTDIDASLSLGTSIKGKSWGRPDDTIGIAGAVNAISQDHRDYLAVGGLGVLVGDGRLNYAHERIFETYYAVSAAKDVTLTLDYQNIVNPGYNADRGPVHVFSGRVHAEF